MAAYSLVRGFRKGFVKQIPNFIGFCFGIVCTHIFYPPLDEMLRTILPSLAERVEGDYIYSVFAVGTIYMAVYAVVSVCTGFFRIVFRSSPGLMGSLAGSLFCLVSNMLMLSVFYNFWLGMKPHSDLMKYAKADDGNIVEAVMLLSPALLGGESVSDLAITLQLEEAKLIS